MVDTSAAAPGVKQSYAAPVKPLVGDRLCSRTGILPPAATVSECAEGMSTAQTELTRIPASCLSEKLPEIVAVDPGVAENPGERAALEFAVKRDHERNSCARRV